MSEYTCDDDNKSNHSISQCKDILNKQDNTYKKLILNSVANDKDNIMCENTMESRPNVLILLNKLLEQNSYKDISIGLNVAVGTVKRWVELQKIPKQYTFEIMKLSKINIDYTKFDFREKDQFFTINDTAKYCYNKTKTIITSYGDSFEDYSFIEPSAGNGVFLKLLPKDKRIGIDIEPYDDEIIKQDFMDWEPENDSKYIVLGNPPFGLRGQMALKFMNHSSKFADYVCFILPQLFESDGKGAPRKRVKGLHLLYSESLKTDFESPNGKAISVQCIFQIWSKHHCNESYILDEINNTDIEIYSLSDGGTPSTTRNKKMFNKCDIYLPSTCFGKDNMKYYSSYDSLPNKKGYGIVFKNNKKDNIIKFKNIKWYNIAFLSTNSAYNIRSSQIINEFK